MFRGEKDVLTRSVQYVRGARRVTAGRNQLDMRYHVWTVLKEGGDRYLYIGETGRTAKIRCGEHLDDAKKRNGSLWPHYRDVHGGRPVQFRSEVC